MTSYSNSTTRKLEGRARKALGRNLHIVASNDNSAGRYFVTGEDIEPWSRWYSLGCSCAEAFQAIEEMNSEDRFNATSQEEWEREMLAAHQ